MATKIISRQRMRKRTYKKWRNTQWKIPDSLRKGTTYGWGKRGSGPRLDPAYLPTACIAGICQAPAAKAVRSRLDQCR